MTGIVGLNSHPFSVAQTLLMAHWDGVLPINPIDLAAKERIVVKPVPNLPYAGKACRDGSASIIEFDNRAPVRRQRFAVAHALGHHALGHLTDGRRFNDDVSQFNLNVINNVEAAANQFAIGLLIPERAIQYFMNKKITSLEKLAELFFVSTVAMKYRLICLGWI